MDSETLTPRQLRALHAGFTELGYRGRDRADRLAMASEMLGLDLPLQSFLELRPGQAGFLLRALGGSEIPAIAEIDEIRARETFPEYECPAPCRPAPDIDIAALQQSVAATVGWYVAVLMVLITNRHPASARSGPS